MKKILLLAILAFSMNAFAQSKQSTFSNHRSPFHSIENLQGRMGDNNLKSSTIINENELAQDMQLPADQQGSIIQIYDSIYDWRWDEAFMEWIITEKEVNFVYDANNNITNKIIQKWNGSNWRNSDQYKYFYDANNNTIKIIYQERNGSSWNNYSQHTYTYDINNYKTSDTCQEWNGSIWKDAYRDIYSYDANNNIISDLYQEWNGSVWSLDQQIYTYDANNNIKSAVSQYWNGSIWENSGVKIIYTHDANNNMTSVLFQDCKGDECDSELYTFSYDTNNNKISELYQWLNDSLWENGDKIFYTYDANNNIGAIAQSWNNNNWVNHYQSIFTYDTNNFTTSKSTKNWNSDGSEVIYGDSTCYYFHTMVVDFNLSSTIANLSAAEGSQSSVNVTGNLIWAVVSDQPWLKVSTASGTGNGTITFTASENKGEARIAKVTVTAGTTVKTITVTQSAANVIFAVSPTSLVIGSKANSTGSVNVTANTTWIATSDQSWLVVSPNTGVNGNGTLIVTATANPTASIRTAIVTIISSGAKQIITITQEAGEAVGVNDLSEGELKLYPNPTNDGFTISGLMGSATIAIVDLNGRLLLRKEISENENISINSLQKGAYGVRIITKKGKFEKKLIKK